MHIHLFISEKAPAGERLRAALRDVLSGLSVIQYSRIEAFDQVIPSHFNEAAVAVVMVGENEELARLADKKGILEKTRTILILPDNGKEALTMGHLLRPRFLTFMSSDFSDVAAVLTHIKSREQKKNLDRGQHGISF